MKRHIEGARANLGELGGLAAKTEKAERRILATAQSRLKDVEAAIARHRPGVETAPDAAQDRYLDLIKERGQLQIVISRANSVLR